MAGKKLLNGVYITKKIMDTWHLKDFQAAGFAGCFMEESGCDPGAYNAAEKSGRFKGSSANGSGYGAGLAQWSNAWKRQIQRQFHNSRPIENWSLDQQIAIVTQGCSESFINLLRKTTSVGQSTDIVLRGYENGSAGKGTRLRSQQSMKAYTWCKTSYMADGSRRTFKDGYIGALTCRTSWANAVLSKMGSVNLADLSGLGTEVSGGFGDGGAGMGNSNAYPVHDEYQTFTGQGGNIFENSKDNAFQMASATSKQTMFSSKDKFASSHTRIYSTNDSCIVLDELKIPYNSNDPDIEYANQGITKEDVAKKSADTSTDKKDTSTGKADKKTNSTDKSNTNKNTKKSK